MYFDTAPPLRFHRLAVQRALPARRALAVLLGMAACLAALLLFAGQVLGGGDAPPTTVTVHSGDTLWSIAAQRYPGDDTRSRVEELMRLNHLSSAQVFSGEQLTLPSS